ncbi:MAG TPA: amidohydrolase family protein [Acidobacteriota bacterium]|mgnify:CR=1 FL=1|nr:amidohydrolase family protein [Acidobacteriota bacterium]
MLYGRRKSKPLVLAACWLALVALASLLSAQSLTEVRGRLYLDGQLVTIAIKDGRIQSITREQADASTSDLPYVAPGLIDNQVNGYLGVDFVSDSLSVDDVRKATEGLWRAGVTTYLPTLTTNTRERLLRSFGVLAQAVQEPDLARSIPGFHLEGPYISPVDGYRGAHNRAWVRPPDWEEFQALNKAAGGKILQVSLAPEVEGAVDFIRKLAAQGIRVALAHHNGSADQIKTAVDHGARISTHLGNGCANTINRHDNPLWPQLADDRLSASIIADGFHLRPAQIQTFFKVKGLHNLILTSDVISLAGMPPGEYRRHEQTVVVAPEGVVRIPAQNVLAGAAATLDRGIENFMRFTGASLGDTIHLATRNPARFYNFNDRGEIATGKRADLILFTLDQGKLTITRTIVAGEVVYDRPAGSR